jgi:D-methionine transport system substrate-binding protein
VAAAGTNYAAQAGLNPNKDAILKENPKCPNGNLIAARMASRGEPWAT